MPDDSPERQQAHALLDRLPQENLAAVRSLLEPMVEPLSESLQRVPFNDEVTGPETVWP